MTSPEPWTPARYIRFAQICESCGSTIAVQSPGTSTGTRGTKAFFSPLRRAWQCLHCRTELCRCERAAVECAGCRALIARFPLPAGGWVHRTRAGAVMPCNFRDLEAQPIAGERAA